MSFFFQAEDGIRDKLVTGVQTCALPISTAEQFNAFMAIVTSDSETDWNTARTGNTTANSSNNSENKFTIVTKKELTDEAKALRKQYEDRKSVV